MKENVLGELHRTFRPEFLNRLDEIIVFHALTDAEIRQIADLMLQDVVRRLKENEVEVEFTDRVKDLLVREGVDEKFGARLLRRTIQRRVEDKLSEELLRGTFRRGDRVLLDAEGDEITVRAVK
jgi:ATP-dependent Clp protease ATP-binding subunit ClpC